MPHAQDVMIEILEDVPEELFLNWVAMDNDVEVTDEAMADEVTQQLAQVMANAKNQEGESAVASNNEDNDPELVTLAKLMQSTLEVLKWRYWQQGFVINSFSASMNEGSRKSSREKVEASSRDRQDAVWI